jgi:hypothetical protein
MTEDVASYLTDREREVLGMISEKNERIRRIRTDVQTGRERNPWSKFEVEKAPSAEDRRRAIEREVSRVNSLIVKEGVGVSKEIHGPLPGLQMPGFRFLKQSEFFSPASGIVTELHAPSAWIFGTSSGERSRTLAYGVKNSFLCPYSTAWRDESRPTQKFSIGPRTYISGNVYAVAEDNWSLVTENWARISLAIKIDLFQISPDPNAYPIVSIGGAPLEKWEVMFRVNDSDTVFLDYEYGYLSYVPKFQIQVPQANVFCEIEVTLEVSCKCGNGDVTVRCGLLDETWGNHFQDSRGRVEIWPRDFGIYPTDYD